MAQGSDALGRGWVERRRAMGAAIRKARHPRTQAEVAAAVGRPQSCVSVWERGGAELGVDRVYELEELFGLRHGALLEAGGYCQPPTPAWWLAPMTRARTNGGVPGANEFPQLAAEWLDRHGALVEAAATLRDLPRERAALDALLGSGPLSHLLLGWELWEPQVLAAGDSPDAVLGCWFSAEAIRRCRYALWGQPAQPVLRLVAE